MKTIGPLHFPESAEEARDWKPQIRWKAIHRDVLLVAVPRIEGTWRCYVTVVPGTSHDEEWYLWEREGVDVGERLARAAYPEYADVPYAR